MRLVTWNCKGAFHRKHEAILQLQPDVLIVPECEQIRDAPQRLCAVPVTSFLWFGAEGRKGLAVLSFGEYRLAPNSGYDPRHRWIVPIRVSGPASFLLLAVWTMPHAESKSYVQPLFEAFESYRRLTRISHSSL